MMNRLALLLLLGLASSVAVTDDESSYLRQRRAYILPERPETTRYFVQYKPHTKSLAQAYLSQPSSADGTYAKLLHEFDSIDTIVIETTEADIDTWRKYSIVQNVQKDVKRYPQYIKSSVKRDDAHRNMQDGQEIPYGVNLVRAPEVWPFATGQKVKVCVVDSGIDATHEDFQNLSGLDGVNGLPWTVDAVGHGTHCSGTIAASDNNVGVVGVAPDAEIYTVRVFGENGFAFSSGLLAAALECEAAGAKIISMSLGGPLPNIFEFLAYRGLMNRGVMTVAAAGNSGNFLLSFPASYSGVLSVGAVDENKNHAQFSQYNFQVDISAPGVDVRSTFPTNQPCQICDAIDEFEYGTISGTSMATPHVSGVAALLLSAFPDKDVQEIVDAMEATAEDLGNPGFDFKFGHGLVDAKSAFDQLSASSSSVSSTSSMTASTTNTNGCLDDEMDFSFTFVADDEETTWDLTRLTGGRVQLRSSDEKGYQRGETVEIMCCIPRDCYSFVVRGKNGRSRGSYSLMVDGNAIVSQGGKYMAEDLFAFGTCLEEAETQDYTMMTMADEQEHQGSPPMP